MTGESLAIILVIFVMAFVFLRAGKRIFAVMVLPLICVPVGYILALMVHTAMGLTYPLLLVASGFIAGGLVLSAGLCVQLSRVIPTRRGKNTYLIFSILFSLLLSLAYLLRI